MSHENGVEHMLRLSRGFPHCSLLISGLDFCFNTCDVEVGKYLEL